MTQTADTSLLVAPFLVLRIAGLPTHYAGALPDDLLALMQQHQRQEPLWQQLGEMLTDGLHSLVALPSADNVRSELIRCRRHLFNRRHFELSTEAVAWLAHYDSQVLTQLQEWLAITDQRRQMMSQFSLLSQQVSAQTQAKLSEAAAEPAVRRALSLAAPQLLADLSQPWQRWPAKRRRRIERSLFAYMIRAAAKVSPFSTFASCSMIPLNTSADSSLQTAGWRVATASHLNRSVALALREAVYAPHLLAERDLPLSRNPSLQRIAEGQLRGHFYRYEKRRGLLWNEEQQFVLNLEPQEIDVILAARPAQNWLQWQAQFIAAGIAAEVAERLLKKLLRKDVLRPQLQWGAHLKAPLASVIELIAAAEASEALRALPQLAARFHDAQDEDRARLLAQAQTTLSQSWQALTHHRMPEIRNLLYEDAWSEGIAMQPGKDFVPEVLARVAKVVGKRASLSLEYLWLRQTFLERYGHDAECTDISLFLHESWQGFIQFSQQLLSQPAAALARLKSHDINPAALRLPVTLFLQMDARSVDELHHPQTKVVINNAYPRIGWQLARTTLTDDSGAATRTEELKKWLRQVAASALPLSFTVSGESSNLQAQARLTEHHLCLDEPQQVAGDITLDQLRLSIDPASGLLQLTDSEGQVFQLCYLGAATPMVAWGTKYLLTVIAEPVQIGRPGWHQLMADEQDDDFRHAARVEEDNCVLIRETWWVRSSRIVQHLAGRPASESAALLLDLLLKNGIPPDSYVNGQFNDSLSWQAFNNDKIRKPMWCRLGNPFCLEQLLILARKVDWLVFREALPSPLHSWMKTEDKQYVTEIHTEMVISADDLELSLMPLKEEKSDA